MNSGGPIETVTVVGAGSGGFGLIANLGAAGYRLRLHDRDDARLAPFRERGGIEIEGGARDFAPIEIVSTDAAACIAGTDLIVVCTGGKGQPGFVRAAAPLLEDGQILLLIQGNTGGSLVARRELAAGGCRANVDVAEFDTYPYGTGRPQPARAQLRFSKRWNQIAAFPGRRSEAVFARLGSLFTQAVMAETVAWTSFTNMNAAFHVANCVGNAGRIEAGQPFKFYAEGVTPAVANLYHALDAERLAVAAALGAEIPDIPEWIDRAFGFREPTLVETFQRLTYDPKGPYQFTPSPPALTHNYVAEDVPTGLMPMSALGAAAGVPTPVIDGIIRLACVMAGHDFAAEARTIERLGLAGQDAAQMRKTLIDGFA
ncbi:MAG TPA: NAD/NADP octopine/nopaline dehydrogenase family protein [Dehalococcoidia bacterium]|nr:NAD/NADP octopine/nopaline dehydrogenase family protein [Dehalococcoidia bacterium]